MSHRTSSGARVNQWGHSIESGGTVPLPDGDFTSGAKRPSHRDVSRRDKWGGTGHASSGEGRNPDGSFKTRNRKSFAEKVGAGAKVHTKNDGDKMREQAYLPPVLANPGNVIKCKVGGGLLGHPLAHENEAPYPLRLAEWYVRSFCQPGGTVLDPFVGSGTTAHAAIVGGRQCIGIDAREDQIAIANRRIGTIERPVVGAT